MHSYYQQKVLESFEIIIDSREKDNQRANDRYDQLGVPYRKSKLDFGDYAFNATLPSGDYIVNQNGTVVPQCAVVERKMDFNKAVACLVGRRKSQFKNELKRAAQADCKLYLICENANWVDIFSHNYRSKVSPITLLTILLSYMARYRLIPIFCRQEESGTLIKEVLYRELKEALQNGFFDTI